ncbi:MAG: cyclic peptide export ABC transporter [Acidobacteriota bacterium]
MLHRGSSAFDGRFVGLIALAGISNAALLAIINAGAENAANQDVNAWLLSLFMLVILLYISTQRHILLTSIREVERILDGIRITLSDRIRRSGLLAVEHIGRAEIYASVNRETVTISQAAATMVIACQSLLLVLFSVGYLAYLSVTAFVLTAAFTSLSLLMHFRRAAELTRLREESIAQENRFFDSLTDLLDGFKEVKMSEPRSEDLFQHLRDISRQAADIKVRTGTGFAEHFIFAQAAFYLLIAVIVFVVPRMSPTYTDVITKATAAILFVIGPLGGVVSSIPAFTNANAAALNILRVEELLSRPEAQEPAGLVLPAPAPFQVLSVRDVTFQYADKGGPAFTVGPLSLDIRRGETTFVVGGNGSGKSTFIKLLTGLYHPQSGVISIDGSPVTQETLAPYRSHFGTIFSDYHLFERLYGLRNVDSVRVQELLVLMDLDRKTAFDGTRFTNLDLSSGQRKRLALLVTLLEDRPIVVLDEWAADQDPVFRRFFYERILDDLKKRGKTIVAVTHDDKYFSVADRILRMDFGQIVPHDAAAARVIAGGGRKQA